jgi:HSP20 family protein
MDDLMDRFFSHEGGLLSSADKLSPTTNMAETDVAYQVSVDLPGVKVEDVSVELKEGHLVISGQRQEETQEEGKTFHLVERRYGQFRRTIPIPGSIEQEQIEAHYKDGVLTITLPKSEAEKTKKIEVKS